MILVLLKQMKVVFYLTTCRARNKLINQRIKSDTSGWVENTKVAKEYD